jgi:hypothetical protein
MSAWTNGELDAIEAAEELELASTRDDGTPRQRDDLGRPRRR